MQRVQRSIAMAVAGVRGRRALAATVAGEGSAKGKDEGAPEPVGSEPEVLKLSQMAAATRTSDGEGLAPT